MTLKMNVVRCYETLASSYETTAFCPRYSVRILAGTPVILTHVYSVFISPARQLKGISRLCHHSLLPNPFQFLYHLTIGRCTVHLLAESLNNPQEKGTYFVSAGYCNWVVRVHTTSRRKNPRMLVP